MAEGDNDRQQQQYGDRLVASADFDGPTKDRHCTDFLCFILIIVSWVVMSAIGAYAVMNGDIRLILNPLDYDGNICGTDFAANMTDFPNLLYINSFAGGVCVKECPNLVNVTEDGLTDMRTLVTYSGIHQVDGAELEPDFIQVGDYSNSTDALSCITEDGEDICFPNGDSVVDSWSSAGINKGYGFAFYAASTYQLLNRCYLTTNAENQIALLVANTTLDESGRSSLVDSEYYDQAYSFWNKLYGDLYTARKYILGFGFGVSMIISLVYIFLMRIPLLLTGIIWTSIFVTIGMFFLGGWYAWTSADEWSKQDPQVYDDQTVNITKGFSIAMFAIGVFLALMACCLRRSIQDAVKCTREAGKAVNSMTFILLVPLLQAVGFLLFLVPLVYYGANLASLGNITTREVVAGVEVPGLTDQAPEVTYRVFEFDTYTERCGWYLLFAFFWTSNFIVALGDLIVATSVAKWYFTKNKLTIGSWTVLGSIIDVCWYHSGTAAYGSLIIALIQLIRAILTKLQKEAEKVNSKIAKCIFCCCQCFFCCLESCMKFINKNAYIQTAIFSTSFCKSCRESFALIFRNAARVAAISYVSAAVLIVGKLFISSVVTVFGYYIIVEDIGTDLYSVGGPVCVIFLISYWISDMFMDVLDMGIVTVLHCFIADEEMFQGDERYGEKSLIDYVDKHGSESFAVIR